MPRERPDVYAPLAAHYTQTVMSRLAVAAFFIGAMGFCAVIVFPSQGHANRAGAQLGMALGAVTWLIDVRTRRIYGDIAKRGKQLEGSEHGLFWTLHPDRQSRWQRCKRFIIAHSRAFDLLYGGAAIYWTWVMWIMKTTPPHP